MRLVRLVMSLVDGIGHWRESDTSPWDFLPGFRDRAVRSEF